MFIKATSFSPSGGLYLPSCPSICSPLATFSYFSFFMLEKRDDGEWLRERNGRNELDENEILLLVINLVYLELGKNLVNI